MTSWYALRSKPNREEFLRGQLASRGIRSYCPQIRVQPANPRARKLRPYFPGYLFVQLDMESVGQSALMWMPGSNGLVMFDGQIPSVPDGMIRAIEKRVRQINAAGGELLDSVKQGDEVMVQSGPFAGYMGIFEARLSGEERVRILLRMLGSQNLRVDLPPGQIQKKKAFKNKSRQA